jgi:lactate racemase
MEISLKYGSGRLSFEVDKRKLIGLFKPREEKALKNLEEEIIKAIKNPLGPALTNIAKPNKKVAIIIDDNTRAVPSNLILPVVLKELKSLGILESDITIIIANGLHRELTKNEISKLVGKKIFEKLSVINHSAYNKREMTYVGEIVKGLDLHVNKIFIDADIKIVIGDVEFHQIFGYGGGYKSILPGISDYKSIEYSHSLLFSSQARSGNLKDNPTQQILSKVKKKINIDYAIQVVLNSENEIVKIFSGNIDKAFDLGVKTINEMYKVEIGTLADVALVSCGGYPRDINIYQAQKAIECARYSIKERGKIILIAECIDGWGSEILRDWMIRSKSTKEISDKINQKFIMGGHKAYLFAKAIDYCDIYLFSKINPSEIKKAFMTPLVNKEEIQLLLENAGDIIILPNGVNTHTVLKA